MRQEFWLPILLVILALACPTIVQAQQAEVVTHQGNAIEDLDQLHDRSEKGDAVAQYELAERHRLGLSVVQDQAKAKMTAKMTNRHFFLTDASLLTCQGFN